jgi:hypothetical protein
MTITGHKGSTPEQRLGSDAGSFERAKVDTFTINAKDLGEIKSLQIRLVSRLEWSAFDLSLLDLI